MRPDFAAAVRDPALPWKLASLLLLSIISAIVAVASLRPERRVRRGLTWIAAAIVPALIAGAPTGSGDTSGSLTGRPAWRHGMDCVAHMAALSLPMVVLATLAPRDAPADPAGALASRFVLAGRMRW